MRSAAMNETARIDFELRMFWLMLPIEPNIMALAGVILVWIAFVRTEWSDRLLFCAAVILSSTILAGGTEGVFRLASGQWYGSTMVCAGTVTYLLCLLLAHRAQHAPFAVLSILAILYSLIMPYYAMYNSLLDILGGVLFAAAILCASFYIAQRAGVRPFANAD
jgi:hypothetical protein